MRQKKHKHLLAKRKKRALKQKNRIANDKLANQTPTYSRKLDSFMRNRAKRMPKSELNPKQVVQQVLDNAIKKGLSHG